MKEQFLAELAALLEKYDVSICFDVGEGSDTYGLHGEHMTLDHRISKNSFKEECWFKVDGRSIMADDLKDRV